MIKNLWNIGVKVTDLDQEIQFMMDLGAKLILRETLAVGDGLDYAILSLGGVRVLLFPKVIFEDLIGGKVSPGLTHAVFEVDDVEAEFQRIKALGAEVLIEPIYASGGFGSRRLAFFRSPGGFVFEIIQILEAKI